MPALTTMLLAVALGANPALADADPIRASMVRVPAASYTPLYSLDGERVEVAAFSVDVHPVTRADFARFVEAHPRWRRDRVPRLFAEPGYLSDWPGALEYGDEKDARRPVTNVSWFAANAYCEARDARLPTMAEWEYLARADERSADAASDPAFRARMLALYTKPRIGLPEPVGSGFTDVHGVADLHGLVWEWVRDFNAAMTAPDSRGTGGRDRNLYCAAAANGATDRGDYAAFLRYALRSTLTGRTTMGNLGFRCAADLPGGSGGA